MSSNYFFYKDGTDLKRIHLENIYFLESAGNYVKFFFNEKEFITVRTPLEVLMVQMLPRDQFVQISRSHAVRIACIEIIAKEGVFLRGIKVRLPLSRIYLSELLVRINVLDSTLPKAIPRMRAQGDSD